MNKNSKLITKKRVNFLILLTTFINIFISIPFFFIGILKKNISPLIGALILSINAYYFIPYKNSDLYRYYELMENSKKLKVIFNQQNDLYLEYLIIFIKKINAPTNLLAFVSCYICYYYLFKSFNLTMFKEKIYNSKDFVLLFLIYFFMIPLTAYHGLRFYPGVAVLTYGIILNYYTDEKKSIIYILISLLIHSSLILPASIYLLSKYILRINKNINLNIFIYIAFFIGIFFNYQILVAILLNFPKIPLDIKNYLLVYINGYFGVEILENKSTVGKIGYYLFYYIRLCIIFLSIKIMTKNKINNYLKLMLIMILLLINLSVFYERFFYSIIYIQFLVNSKTLIKKRVFERLYLLFLCLNSCILLLMFFRTQHSNIFGSYINILSYNLLSILYNIFY